MRVWDLRQRCLGYTVPAHGGLVSEARFDPSGEALLTCSFDGKARVWACRDWRLLADLSGHEGKLMGGDWVGGARPSVITAGYDRTLKQWAPEERGGF